MTNDFCAFVDRLRPMQDIALQPCGTAFPGNNFASGHPDMQMAESSGSALAVSRHLSFPMILNQDAIARFPGTLKQRTCSTTSFVKADRLPQERDANSLPGGCRPRGQ